MRMTISKTENHDEIIPKAKNNSPYSFGFPFQPYSIQLELMQNLYNALEKKSIALLESPTGTGKSLSLICGALSWLEDNWENPDVILSKANESDNLGATTEVQSAKKQPAWVKAQFKSIKLNEKMKELQKLREDQTTRITLARELEARGLSNKSSDSKFPILKKRKVPQTSFPSSDLHVDGNQTPDDSEFLLSENETPNSIDNCSPIKKDVSDLSFGKATIHQDPVKEIQLIYSSRTHTQLSQFIHEFKKTRFASKFRCISLGSRKHLCIHPDVQRKAKGQVAILNDLCLDFQNHKTKKCPYLTQGQLSTFADLALTEVRDIEDLVTLGESLKTCPYYGTRQAMSSAHLIAVPYPSLLHPTTRESLNLSIQDQVLLIDEAHNLPETINQLHSISLSSLECQLAHHQLSLYLQRYATRLSRNNYVHLQHLLLLLSSLNELFEHTTTSFLCTVNEFVFKLNIDHLNVFKLESYLNQSDLCKKLKGFSDQFLNSTSTSLSSSSSSSNAYVAKNLSPLFQIQAFFMKLVNPDVDGRVSFSYSNSSSELKYISLNPALHVEPLFKEARSVILAGGTLSPISDFTRFLIPKDNAKELIHFSCGHVIPDHHLFAAMITKDSLNTLVKCAYEDRKDSSLFNRLGQLLCNIAHIVPRGMVVFVPSYQFLEELKQALVSNGQIERLEKKKKVFYESHGSSEVEQLLRDYSIYLSTAEHHGAILFSVVGGKLSEGINFSDDLARCVVMIGLPYPNASSLELREKMKYIEALQPNHSAIYYENLCMRAVNQSIGRAIRHAKDYAAILLVDHRYTQSSIQTKLPTWIKDKLAPEPLPFAQILRQLALFYKNLRNST